MKMIKILILKNNIVSNNSYCLFKIIANNLYTKNILANIFRRYLLNTLV